MQTHLWLAWNLGVCSSQGLRFDSLYSQFRWTSSYRVLLYLKTESPQVGGEIGPLRLIGPWTEYRVLRKTQDMHKKVHNQDSTIRGYRKNEDVARCHLVQHANMYILDPCIRKQSSPPKV